MDIKSDTVVSPVAGFAVSFLMASFAWYGIAFVLYLLDRWQVSTINTIILYAMLFILAKVGTQYQHRRRMPRREEAEGSGSGSPLPERPHRAVLLSALWYTIGIYAIVWLTPSVMIYWTCLPPYPPHAIMLFAYLFGFTAAAVFFFGDSGGFTSWTGKAGYVAGACLGPAALHAITI